MVTIRHEAPADYARVEEITRRAFYNLYMPGCVEHYLVRIMRTHPDFVPELDFVIELDGVVIGSIQYTKAKLMDESGTEREILTFGPVSIQPEYQRQGYGKQLLEYSFEQAAALGYDVIVIFGDPANYVSRGFRSCKRHNVCVPDGSFPAAMLVKELAPGALDGRRWAYRDSPVMQIDEQAALAYDDSLPPLAREQLPCQEVFYILSQATLASDTPA